MDIQQTIKNLLKAGLTQKDIADKAGCSQSNVSMLANGVITNPSFKIASAIFDLEKDVQSHY